MWEKPKVVSLEQYKYRRYLQDLQKERAIYMAALFTEMKQQEEQKEEKKDGHEQIRTD